LSVNEAAAAPKTSHEGAARHIEKEELEVKQSNLKFPAGRVRHDDRGAAVWDWALDTGVIDALSSSALIRRLDVPDLKMQESPVLGGGDPYNFRGAESRALPPRRSRIR